jgi:hypothetical protein
MQVPLLSQIPLWHWGDKMHSWPEASRGSHAWFVQVKLVH